jgi:hypothetical protein
VNVVTLFGFGCPRILPVMSAALAIGSLNAQDSVPRDVVVEAEELPSAYGAPPDLSRGRISTLTKSYVLPPFGFELEGIYQGDIFWRHAPRHQFTQEIEMGLPARFTIGVQNELERSSGDGGERSFGLEARYALADWNKIPLNPTLSAQYQFGITDRVGDNIDFALLLSHDFRHMVEWAFNCFVEQELNGRGSTAWGFAQSAEVPVLLPHEQLEVGLEMQYRHLHESNRHFDQTRGFVIGPTLAWRPSKNARLDLSPLIGCTNNSPILQMFVVFSWSLGKSEAGETEMPASTR